MNIEIQQPKLEALLQQRMAEGDFASVEELLFDVLRREDPSEDSHQTKDTRMGSELIAAMQAMPYKDVEFEYPDREFLIRDVEF